MFILRAIGKFFARIGRWIKNTAWVQPLLIVGGLFAIIFSIPYITAWVQSWFAGGSEATKYYRGREVSLTNAQTHESDVDKLLTYMKNDNPSAEDKEKWGTKFYVAFVQEECSGCESIYKAFQVLESEFGTGEFERPIGNTDKFKLYTIFVDKKETINNEEKNLFKDYVFATIDYELEDIYEKMQDCPYAKSGKAPSTYQSDLETLTEPNKFATPTVFLYEANGPIKTQLHVSECQFTVKGKDSQSGPYPIARTLFDCWYHQGDFQA